MSRSPLMTRVLRMAHDVGESEDLGVPVEEVHQGRIKRGISRRDFLAASGASMTAVSILGPGALARATGSPRIGIIGGGIAGLNAALTLQDAGYASTIFEASDRLGGRMHSNMSVFWQQGQTSEWCGELIDTGHKTIQHLVQRFNLNLVDEIQAQPQGSQDTYYVHGQYYTYSQALSDFKPVHNTLPGQIQQAPFPTLYNQSTSFGQCLDSISVYQWIEQYVPGGHASNLSAVLDSAYNNEYGLDTTQQSSLNLVYLLGYQSSPGNFSTYGLSDERYHIQGGNQQLPLAIASRLTSAAPACSIKTQWKMTSIATNKDGSITPPSAATRVRVRERSTLLESTARSTSRNTWRAEPAKEHALPMRSCRTTNRGSIPDAEASPVASRRNEVHDV